MWRAGDGLNDWEKYQLGLDPSNPYSNGHLDTNGQPIADFQYAMSMMATQNIISIVASDPTTMQPDPGQTATDMGQFTVSRIGLRAQFSQRARFRRRAGQSALRFRASTMSTIFPSGHALDWHEFPNYYR